MEEILSSATDFRFPRQIKEQKIKTVNHLGLGSPSP